MFAEPAVELAIGQSKTILADKRHGMAEDLWLSLTQMAINLPYLMWNEEQYIAKNVAKDRRADILDGQYHQLQRAAAAELARQPA